MQLGIDQDSVNVLALLTTEICKQLFLRNRLKTYIDIENIFTTTKTLTKAFTIFSGQKDYNKKLIQQEFQTSEDYDDYILNFLSAIKHIYKFDVLTYKNSKFIFFHFNNYLSQINEPAKPIYQIIVSDDVLA